MSVLFRPFTISQTFSSIEFYISKSQAKATVQKRMVVFLLLKNTRYIQRE